jgi:hypothetical protein
MVSSHTNPPPYDFFFKNCMRSACRDRGPPNSGARKSVPLWELGTRIDSMAAHKSTLVPTKLVTPIAGQFIYDLTLASVPRGRGVPGGQITRYELVLRLPYVFKKIVARACAIAPNPIRSSCWLLSHILPHRLVIIYAALSRTSVAPQFHGALRCIV